MASSGSGSRLFVVLLSVFLSFLLLLSIFWAARIGVSFEQLFDHLFDLDPDD